MNTARRIRNAALRVRRYLERDADTCPDLTGCCGRASAMVAHALVRDGFKPVIAHAPGHAFVLCEGYLVDVTATQFGWEKEYPKVVVRKMPSTDKRPWFWKNYRPHNTVYGWLRSQKRSGWYQDQMASKDDLEFVESK